MNHYPRHIGDWMVATAHLTEVEECIYSRLMDAYYARESPLPPDVAACCRLVRAASTTTRKAVGTVLHEFFVEQADGWHQKRCDEELAKFRERSESAKRSISVRWDKRNTDADTNVLQTKYERNTNQEPVTSNHKPGKTTTRARAPAVPDALPDWLPPDAWEQWQKHRGQKLTPQAIRLQIKKLDELRRAGFDPARLIALAIESGWATFYPPRSNGQSSVADKRQVVLEAIFGEQTHGKRPDTIDGTAERVG